MTRNNKIVTYLISVLVIISVSFGAYKYIIIQDYLVYLNAPCEVGSKFACFVYEDQETGELSEPYLKLYRKAFELQSCVDTGLCDSYVCHPGEEDCTLTTCDVETVEEGESCLTQQEYEEAS